MSMDLLARTDLEALRAGADAVNGGQDQLNNELNWLNEQCSRLIQGDWDGEASEQFATSWRGFRTVLAFHIGIADETGAALRELVAKLEPLQREYQRVAAQLAAEGMEVNPQTGQAGLPSLLTTPELAGQLAAEGADELRVANLRLEDLLQEASAIERQAALTFENLLQRLNNYEPELAALAKNINSGVEAITQGAGAVAGAAAGLQAGTDRLSRKIGERRDEERAARRTPNSAAAKARLKETLRTHDRAGSAAAQWRQYARNPLVVAGTKGFKGVPVLGTALTVGTNFMQQRAEGNSVEESATTAIVSGAITGAVSVGVGAGISSGMAFFAGTAILAGGPITWAVVGGIAVTGTIVAPLVQQYGDAIGQTVHEHFVSPIAREVSATWEDLFG